MEKKSIFLNNKNIIIMVINFVVSYYNMIGEENLTIGVGDNNNNNNNIFIPLGIPVSWYGCFYVITKLFVDVYCDDSLKFIILTSTAIAIIYIKSETEEINSDSLYNNNVGINSSSSMDTSIV